MPHSRDINKYKSDSSNGKFTDTAPNYPTKKPHYLSFRIPYLFCFWDPRDDPEGRRHREGEGDRVHSDLSIQKEVCCQVLEALKVGTLCPNKYMLHKKVVILCLFMVKCIDWLNKGSALQRAWSAALLQVLYSIDMMARRACWKLQEILRTKRNYLILCAHE